MVIKISNKPADLEHPYVHGKAENRVYLSNAFFLRLQKLIFMVAESMKVSKVV